MESDRSRSKWFDDRFVAFVDILGFRGIVSRMRGERKLFLTVRDALKIINAQSRQFRDYRVARKQSHERFLANGETPSSPPTQLQMTSFSDCYVISETSPAGHVLAGVQALGAALLAQGILCRGAVVRGDAYHRGHVLFGPAVIEAYDLESRVAKYPRILVTESVRKVSWGYHTGKWRSQLFIRDTDGLWFLNVLTPSLSKWKALSTAEAEVSSRKFLKSVRKWLGKELIEAQNDLGRLSKLQWLAHHFNTIAQQKGGVDLIEFPGP